MVAGFVKGKLGPVNKYRCIRDADVVMLGSLLKTVLTIAWRISLIPQD